MGREINKLTAVAVKALKLPGNHSDGGGLYLKIDATRKAWIFRYVSGKAREMGLGGYPKVSLAEARGKAVQARQALAAGHDPIQAKKAVPAQTKTFGQCAGELIASKESGWRNVVHRGQWRTTLETYAGPLWGLPVDQVDTAHILAVLQPHWHRIPETASRLRGRIEAVLNYAKAHGWRSGENPAAWRGHLALAGLSKRPKLSHGHHAAMRYSDVPAFMAQLRQMKETVPSLALQFTILTAGRSGEVLGARWPEIDFATKIWVLPRERMKAGVEHRVPLSEPAVEILKRMAEVRTCEYVFAGNRAKPLSGSAMIRVLAGTGVTVHGFRSSFRDWCRQETNFPREIAELSLAHRTGDSTERAYLRGDALEKRRGLMEQWGNYLCNLPRDNIVRIAG